MLSFSNFYVSCESQPVFLSARFLAQNFFFPVNLSLPFIVIAFLHEFIIPFEPQPGFLRTRFLSRISHSHLNISLALLVLVFAFIIFL